jgi:hypothetical protein
VNQPPRDLRDHLNTDGADIRGRIEDNRSKRYQAKRVRKEGRRQSKQESEGGAIGCGN